MGCNCGKKAGSAPKSYIHVAADGTETPKRTEIEVKAEIIRKGGSMKVKTG